jgi:cytochrome c553
MPDFRLTTSEAEGLAQYVRDESKGKIAEEFPAGDAVRGEKLFTQKNCQQCHSVGQTKPVKAAILAWKESRHADGCLAADSPTNAGVPAFAFSEDQRQSLRAFLDHDLSSLHKNIAVETSSRLFQSLQCANCHDRDGQRAHRSLVIADEGSGRIPEQLPQLTWAGEKLQPGWTQSLLAGELTYKSRPWIAARMPALPAYANVLAHGLAAEHGIDPQEQTSHSFDTGLASIGEKLTLQTGLDCRQCHAIGSQQPRGDKETKIALGINLSYIRERMRLDSYQRFMLNPPRYDINTKMIRLSEDGLTTKLKAYFDADAKQQFGALWHYMQSLPDASEIKDASQ